MGKWKVLPYVLTAFLSLTGGSSFANTCLDYPASVSEATVQLHQSLGAGMIQTERDIAYWFDGPQGTHLDVIDFTDPTNIQGTGYSPAVFVDPPPFRLMKITADRLYAFNANGVTVIDISDHELPGIVSQIASFGEGSYLGEHSGYAYFFSDPTLHVYDFTNPDAPALLTSIGIAATEPLIGGAVGDDRVYLIGQDYTWWIVNVDDPSNPTATEIASPTAPFRASGPVVLEGAQMSYLESTACCSDTAILDLSNRDNPVFLGAIPTRIDLRNHDVSHAFVFDEFFNIDLELHETGQVLDTLDLLPFAGNLSLTDKAIVLSHGGSPPRVGAYPRQCDAPAIDDASYSATRTPLGNGQEDRTFRWTTDGWTDEDYDTVEITLGSRSPAQCAVGAVTLVGGDPVEFVNGEGFVHSVTGRFDCIPGCSYDVRVKSRRTGLWDTSQSQRLKIWTCLGS